MNVLLGVDLQESLRQGLCEEFPSVTFRLVEKDSELSDALRDCNVALLSRISDADIATAEHLRWVQVWSAGVEHLPEGHTPELRDAPFRAELRQLKGNPERSNADPSNTHS